MDIAPCPTTTAADVVLPGVIDAMECDGTFYRLDNVPVHFEPFTESPFPETKSNEETLKMLFEKIKAKKEAAK
jgi:formylmethanofuran dehydrogenase subunit B